MTKIDPEGTQLVNKGRPGKQGADDDALPYFDLLTTLQFPRNSATSHQGAYRQVGYAIEPTADDAGWVLKIHGQCADIHTGEVRLCELLHIGFSTSERRGQRVKWVSTRGYRYQVTDALVFRAFMAAGVIIARIDNGECPDVLKILKLYGLRKTA